MRKRISLGSGLRKLSALPYRGNGRKNQKRIIAAIICLLLAGLTACSSGTANDPANMTAEQYRDLLTSFDYGGETTYVIGHKSPDSDTVGSAMAYAYLLNQLGINAQAAVSARVNNETQYALDFFGLEAPPVIDNAEGKQFILVDHSTYSQTIDGMDGARVAGIVDHHGIGDVTTSEQINVRSAPVGATASLIFLSYQECDVEIPRDMARVMLMSLLSDTRNMKRNVTEIDRAAYNALTGIADIEDIDALYQGMAEALASYGEMSDREIYLSDYKEYDAGGKTFGIADVNAFGEEKVREMAERMLQVMGKAYEDSGLDYLFTIINNKGDDDSENMMYMVAFGNGAEEVLEEAFHNFDGDRFFVFKENLSRKTTIVPALSEIIEAHASDKEQLSAHSLPEENVGIISAMENEVALLLQEAQIDHVDTIGGVDFHVGTLHGVPVVIMRSGIGKVMAASAATAMLNNYPISRVIFTGIAGGVGDETRVLDQVIATRLVQHDYGTITNDGFVWSSGVTGEEMGEKDFYTCDPELVELAYEAAVQVLGEEHVFKGIVATGDQFVASEEYVRILQDAFDAIACEMEGASIAAVCTQYGVPFVVIRAMSDKADGNAHETIENMGDIAADNSSRIVMRMLDAMLR